MNVSVLLLNANAQPLSLLPLSTINWQTAIKTIYSSRAHVVKNYDGMYLHSSRVTIPLPSIIMYNNYHKSPSRAKFNRKNLYIRDNYRCQYCGEKFASSELTIDHVIPKSHGGKLTWKNSVAACKKCNFLKGDKLVKPLNAPYMPSWHQLNQYSKRYKLTIPDGDWQDFLQWPTENLDIASNVMVEV